MRLVDVARTALPGEEIVAAGIFQAAGSLTARVSGFGLWSLLRRQREERASSGLAFKRYMLVVVTPTQVHVFDARSELTRWKARELLATWDRAAIQAWTDSKPLTVRLTLEIPSENRRVELEGRRSRATAGRVAEVLASDPLPLSAHGSVTHPAPSAFAAVEPVEPAELRAHHTRAGILALAGGLARLLAYPLAWIVVTSRFAGRSASVSGYQELGAPVISIGYSLVIVGAAVFYLAGRREAGPRLLLTLGLGSVLAFFYQLSTTFNEMGDFRTYLQARGVSATTSLGFGVWVETGGVILTLAGGLYAYMVWKKTRDRQGSYRPHRPDVAVSEALD